MAAYGPFGSYRRVGWLDFICVCGFIVADFLQFAGCNFILFPTIFKLNLKIVGNGVYCLQDNYLGGIYDCTGN